MIYSMMRHRRVYVDQGMKSILKAQNSGISLTPLLPIITMTVLLHDAASNPSGPALLAYNRGDLADVVYAEDALLLDTSDPYLHDYLSQVLHEGVLYGMQPH